MDWASAGTALNRTHIYHATVTEYIVGSMLVLRNKLYESVELKQTVRSWYKIRLIVQVSRWTCGPHWAEAVNIYDLGHNLNNSSAQLAKLPKWTI